jgi:uncharacterized protein (DUF1697 family)
MADVQAAFTRAGCRNVTTYIASGNVIFDAPASEGTALRRRIAGEMRTLLGAEPVIVYRTGSQLQKLVEAAPFAALADDRLIKLYIVFLVEKPRGGIAFPRSLPKEALEAIGMNNGDALIVSRRKPNGMYGFPANWIEKDLGVVATARNWSTVTKLATLARRKAKLDAEV